MLAAITLTIYLVVLSLGEKFLSNMKNSILLIILLNLNIFAIITSTVSVKALNEIKLNLTNLKNLESVEGLDTAIKISFSSKKISHIIDIDDVKLKSDRGVWINRWGFNEKGVAKLLFIRLFRDT